MIKRKGFDAKLFDWGNKISQAEAALLEEVAKLEAVGNKQQALQLLRKYNEGCDRQFARLSALRHQAKLQVQLGQYQQACLTYALVAKHRWKSAPNKKHAKELFQAAFNAATANNIPLTLELHCQLIGSDPNHADGLRNFAVLLKRQQSLEEAEAFARRYLELRPDCARGLNTLATILSELGRHPEAIDLLKQALARDPLSGDVKLNLSNEYHYLGEIDLSYIFSSEAIASQPDNLACWLDHLTHLRRVCAFDRIDRVDWWALLSQLPPSRTTNCFLQVLVMAESEEDQLRLIKHVKAWGDDQVTCAEIQPLAHRLPKDSAIPLRIGFLSADLRDHSVARFLWPLFEHLDPMRFQLYGYSTFPANDQWRIRFATAAKALREVGHLSPRDLCNTIRGDEIDILFDLTGFTKGSRTGILAWRAAPVQVSWLGFPGSTGLSEMDYLFLDRYLVPKDPALIREKPLLTQGTTVCFSQLDEVPITQILPELLRGYLTIGTLNNSYKINRSTIWRWAQVLKRIDTAHFFFVRREFQSYYLRQHIIEEFARHGIASDRIHFYNNRMTGRHYLDCYNEIDFTLDTFPVTGGTTTTDALWMGVPVVTLEGDNIHQRVCSAILNHAGHPEWIAKNNTEFIEIAINLAVNRALRVELRKTLRERIRGSLLCNSRQFASDFASAIETLRASQ